MQTVNQMFIDGFSAVMLDPICFIWVIVGTIVGVIFGSVPGLTATMAIAMFLPVTYGLTTIQGISLLLALYIGGISGGLIPAILINIPGTPSSIATCFDGVPLANKGQAGKALGVGIVYSFIGTILSVAALVTIAPPLAAVALKFGPYEYFSITIFSLTLIITLASDNMIKGIISGVFGLMLATVGMAPIDSMTRYTFGNSDMRAGFDILVVLVGIYAISEIIATVEQPADKGTGELRLNKVKIKGFGFSLKELNSQWRNCLRSAGIGIGLGILPGIGAATANIMAYSVAKNNSKYPEKFGTGIIDGVVASETANNACVGGTIIPLLTLGIPGDSTSALLLGALIIQGVTPGPLIFAQNGDLVYAVYVAMVLSSFAMVAVQFLGLNWFVKLLKLPKYRLLPLVFVLCAVGALGLNNRIFDILLLLVFGIVGYLLNKGRYPLPPLILGFVLGPLCELNLRRALSYSQGELGPFFTQPLSLLFLVCSVLSLVFGVYKARAQRRRTLVRPEEVLEP